MLRAGAVNKYLPVEMAIDYFVHISDSHINEEGTIHIYLFILSSSPSVLHGLPVVFQTRLGSLTKLTNGSGKC